MQSIKHCIPKEEIDNYIKNGILSIYFGDILLKQKDNLDPKEKYYKDIYNYLSPNDGLIYVIAYSDVSFKTDNSMILQQFEELNFPKISDVKNSYSFGQDQIFAFITIQRIRLGENYERSYVKIHTILTGIGGLIKALTLLGNLLNYCFSKPFFLFNDLVKEHNLNFSESNFN